MRQRGEAVGVGDLRARRSTSRCGAIRSCTGPSNRWMNAADTRCGPARDADRLGRACSGRSGSDCAIAADRCRAARRARRRPRPRSARRRRAARAAVTVAGRWSCSETRKHVLAVGGELVRRRTMPPRVPNGRALDLLAAATRARHVVGDVDVAVARRVADRQAADLAAAASGTRRAASATASARRRCCRSSRSWCRAAASRRRRCRAPSRSLTDCAYSARLRRWNVRRPGIGTAAALVDLRSSACGRAPASAAGSGRRAAGGGGICPARSLRIIFSVVSRSRWRGHGVTLE